MAARRRLGHLAAALQHAAPAAAVDTAVGAGAAAIVEYDADALAATTAFNTRAGGDPDASLSAAQLAHFMIEGYCVLPGILDEDYTAACKADVDQIEVDRVAAREGQLPAPNNVGYESIGKLCSHPPTVRKIQQLMRAYGSGRDDFAMHHVNASRLDAGAGPANWHQDYHCAADCFDRTQLMVHVFYYFNGLDGQVGDLIVLPRSQYNHWGSLGQMFEAQALPGSRTFDSLPPGSAVVCHSALVHGRRAKPGGEGRPRYFVDVSYCQPGEMKWPASGDWGHLETFELAKSKGHDRSGAMAHIFDFEHFYCSPGGSGEDTRPENVATAQARKQAYREQVRLQTGGAIPVNSGNDLF